ncbi:MAG: hypothetical protein PHF37_03100 [Phycisphaerae bacterium]|nr:hypothetical protein [Phycisphaerae bacterium]
MKQINWYTILIVCLLLITVWILFCLLFSGCSINSDRNRLEIVRADGPKTVFVNETWQGLLCYFTSTKQVHKISPISDLIVGSIESSPDPNSIKALGTATGAIAGAAIRTTAK